MIYQNITMMVVQKIFVFLERQFFMTLKYLQLKFNNIHIFFHIGILFPTFFVSRLFNLFDMYFSER